MELQLGLAPPTHTFMKGFDLNYKSSCLNGEKYAKNARRFEETNFEKINDDTKPTLLSLLLWNDKPNEDDDKDRENKRACHNNIHNDNEEEDEVVVGWPPIKSWRKKLQFNEHQLGRIQNRPTAIKNCGGFNSMYVKVKMEGVSIGRKIDLNNYASYETLLTALIGLFDTYEKGGTNYTLAYQDKEGDWLLAGDVPWKTFIVTVQRLEILRNGVRA